jgi:hypothetical protein
MAKSKQQKKYPIEEDLVGRVKSTKLAQSNPLLPLFEAIVNSIHSIEDAKLKSKGKISIKIERDMTLNFDQNDPYFNPIKSFVVVDNGIGFNDGNWNSFLKAHSTHKQDRGSKGLGRFLWLKAFAGVQIESVFGANGTQSKRTFSFSLANKGIGNYKRVKPKVGTINSTTVKLNNMLEDFQNYCPKKPSTIANKIIEHCLIYFLDPKDCPQIELINDNDETFDLNKIFKESIAPHRIDDTCKVDKYSFAITILKIFNHDEINSNSVHLCADKRQVEEVKMNEIIPDLKGKLLDTGTGKHYFVVAYVQGKYFDKRTNDERTDIQFAKTGRFQFNPELISEHELFKALNMVISKYLVDQIAIAKEEKVAKIREFVSTKSPQYRSIFKYPQYLDELQLPTQISDDELELKLFKIFQKIEFNVKKDVQEAIREEVNIEEQSFEENKKRLVKIIEEANDVGKSKLAQYVVHRKLILDLFEKTLEVKKEDGKYQLEDSVHDIIFPLKTTSDSIDYEKQNLWLIDEKLSFHNYLASDKPLSTNEKVEINSDDRPDILIFNNPNAFIEGENAKASVVIIEFKRPMRKGFPEDDKPFSQVFGYIRKIRSGKAIDGKGRPILITDNTPFYVYIICDITAKVKELAEEISLTNSPDNDGYFGYNTPLKAYIDVISYSQLLSTAKKRNKVLFDKLGLTKLSEGEIE